MNGQTLSLRRRVYNQGDACAGVAMRWTDLRVAGISHRLYFLPGDSGPDVGSPVRPDQLY